MSPKEELVKERLTLADDDLRLAGLTMKDTEPVYWAAAFHCQQAHFLRLSIARLPKANSKTVAGSGMISTDVTLARIKKSSHG